MQPRRPFIGRFRNSKSSSTARLSRRNRETVTRTELSLAFDLVLERSSWVAARAKAENIEDEPNIRAHTNPVYFLKEGDPVHIAADRQSVRVRWEKEAAYYGGSSLIFAEPNQRAELLTLV